MFVFEIEVFLELCIIKSLHVFFTRRLYAKFNSRTLEI